MKPSAMQKDRSTKVTGKVGAESHKYELGNRFNKDNRKLD